MSKKRELLIVESPTKARTIFRLLGQQVKVMSTTGHISDLPKSKLGVDIEHNFEPDYIRIRGKGPVIKELQKAARDASTVYLGCDPDREGEAIAFAVANEIAGKEAEEPRDTKKTKARKAEKPGPAGKGPVVKRVLFYEITRSGLAKAFEEAGKVDLNKVYSHRGRRVLDRLVGYLVSPLLWRIVRRGTSAGRVQTVALRVLVEREREIAGFKPSEYWTVKAVFATAAGKEFEAVLARIKGKEAKVESKAAMEAVKAGCGQAAFAVSQVKARTKHRKPLPPFTTATMQQDAAQKLGLPARRTMQLAQQLFEGIEVKGEPVGLLTYPRTDSVRVAAEFTAHARDYIGQVFGARYLPEQPRAYKERKSAQGAHEAIRPTGIQRTPDVMKEYLNRDQFRLYDLVYRRYLASQMADSAYAATEVTVAGGDYEFRADAVKCDFDGFERVYGDREKERVLPALAEGEPVKMTAFNPEQKFTQPPPRYTEASLIKKLEYNGIGRPSTYATIVSTLFDRKYVERKEGKLWPTEIGMVVNDLLIPRFTNVFEIGFTRELEEELDMVEEGKEQWQQVVGRLYAPLKEDLDKLEQEAPELKQGLQKLLDEKCPECGKPLTERWGRFGKFISCSGYPDCKYIKKDKKEPPKLLEEKCPQCGKPLVERTSRFGKFIACSGYPDCKYVKRDAQPDVKPGDKCPQCGKPLVEKRGRFGLFVACPGYPECKFMVRGKRPEPKLLEEKCPKCGKPMVERTSRFGKFIACSGYPKCKYVKKDKDKAQRDKGTKGPRGGIRVREELPEPPPERDFSLPDEEEL